MATIDHSAEPKKYIPEWIKLDFFNDSNLKNDIQNRISPNIKIEFINALNHLKGDNRGGDGISFSEITLLAMAYFYSEIFTDKIKDSYYSLEMVKGFLDANNLTSYTAIHEIDVEYFKLQDAPHFRHCWLIIQCAWYFNSEYFGYHQYVDYINHFILTGEKLPINNYKFDKSHLEKKYKEFGEQKNSQIPLNEFKLVSDWYFGILFLVCKELKLSTTHFNVLEKDNREFNPITKTARILRNLAPFKIIECDIKSAFPTFIDVEIGSNLKDHVYSNLMLTNSITRGAAKVLFNTYCNSGQYKSKEETIAFFLGCGYTNEQCIEIIEMTHDPKRKFYFYMTEHESLAMQYFIVMNDLHRGTRLHDALLFIDNAVKPQILTVKPNCDFGYKAINRPVIQESFRLSNKRLRYAYISSIPQGLNMVTKHEGIKSEIKGQANGFVFYKEKFQYLNASFNLNDFSADYSTLCLRIDVMLSRIWYLNGKATKSNDIYQILKHIRTTSQYVFNVRALYLRVMKFKLSKEHIFYKERNYGTTEYMLFKKKIDFLKARNEAEKTVNAANNYKELFCLIEDRIRNEDYGYIKDVAIRGHRRNNSLIYAIVQKFNLLVTGRQRFSKFMERDSIKSEPLYCSTIKGLLFKSLSLKKQMQKAFIKNGIRKYEKDVKEYKKLIDNRLKAQQLFLILSGIVGIETDLNISQDVEIQKQLKGVLIVLMDRNSTLGDDYSVENFDKKYLAKKTEVSCTSDLENIFDPSLANSIFNHISIEESSARGEVFFNEYLKFHNLVQTPELLSTPISKKKEYKFPELNFEL